jgi:hypothetical protein
MRNILPVLIAICLSSCASDHQRKLGFVEWNEISKLKPGINIEEVKMMFGDPIQEIMAGDTKYLEYKQAFWHGERRTVRSRYIPFDTSSGRILLKYVRVESTPSRSSIEIKGLNVGVTPYLHPVAIFFEELPTAGSKPNFKLAHPQTVKFRSIPTQGYVEEKEVYICDELFQTENSAKIVFFTNLTRVPQTLDLNLRYR